MTNQDLKIAVVGCGYWGKNLVRNFAEFCVLTAVSDTNTALAEASATTYNVPALSFDDVLQSDVHGVVIAAPAAQHASLARQALMAGKDVFVEKPLALEVEEASDLSSLAHQLGRTLMVGHLLQYHPAFIELKQLVKAGRLGRLRYLYSNRLNLGKFRNEENILWSFAPHDISTILSLAGGTPERVTATGLCHLSPQIHDVTTTHLHFKEGIQAHIFVSWLHPFKEQKLVVVGEEGMAVFDDGQPWESKLHLYPHKVGWIDGKPQPEKAVAQAIPLTVHEPLRAECSHFLECIQSRRTPRTDGEEGVRVLRVLDAAQKALMSRQEIFLDPQAPNYFIHETARLDPGCTIGKGTKIWHFSHILGKTTIGENCTIGQNVAIGPSIVVGNHCKIQNNVSLYKGVTLEDGVFCGPSCVFTNVNTPRAQIERKNAFLETRVERGVTIGANATIVCGHRLGAYALIGAGAVVTKDVPPHALVVGNPARQIGWVSHAGEKLGEDMVCPREGRRYIVNKKGELEEIVHHDRAANQ